MKTVVIQSIGTAKPQITKVLADAFDVNHQVLTQMIYNAPCVFLHEADEETATKAKDLLESLGLEVLVQNADEQPPEMGDKYDVAVYIHKPQEIKNIANQLSDFIGVSETEALGLLIQDPAVVLGNVSFNTAMALQKRIDAEVMISNPTKALYTVKLNDSADKVASEFAKVITGMGLQMVNNQVSDLSYEQAQTLKKKFANPTAIFIFNQDFQRFRITLNAFDKKNDESVQFLHNEVGMPEELISELEKHLPVILEESLSKHNTLSFLEICSIAKLECQATAIPFGQYILEINNISKPKIAEKTLSFFFDNVEVKGNKWKAPKALANVFSRLVSQQLESIGCDVESVYE